MSSDPAPRPDSAEKAVADTPLTTQNVPAEGMFAFPPEAPASPIEISPAPASLPIPKPVLKVVSPKPAPERALSNAVPFASTSTSVEPVSQSTAAALTPELDQPYSSHGTSPAWRRWNVAWVAALVLGIVAGVEFFLLVSQPRRAATAVSPPAASTITIESTPPGAEILINGQHRGNTPSTMTLSAGEYAMSVRRGTVARSVPLVVRAATNQHLYFAEAEAAITPDSTPVAKAAAAAPSPVPSPPNAVGGWISVEAPIDVQLFEGGALIGSNRSDRIMLPVGRHVIEATSASLGYKTSNTIQVAAGSLARLRLQIPSGTVNINALPWADVVVDGKKLGTTPLGNVSLPIGTHEIVFTHPQLGERRQTVTVAQNGVNRVSVNFSQR
jgi:hypothetical protein